MKIMDKKSRTMIKKLNKLKMYEKNIQVLKELKNIQSIDGNWNYDKYMLGLANGLILAVSLFEGGKVEYLKFPDKFVIEIPDKEAKQQLKNQ